MLSPVIAGLALALYVYKTSVLGGLATGVVCLIDFVLGLTVVRSAVPAHISTGMPCI